MTTQAKTRPALEPIPALRGRRRLRTFYAIRKDGAYRPSPRIADRIENELTGFANREAAWRLLVWLFAIHGRPGALGAPFLIVREVLANVATLGLTQAQIRGAIATLETIGALERAGEGGWQKGKPRRAPTRFQFAGWIFDVLAAANARAKRFCKSPEASPTGKYRFGGIRRPLSIRPPSQPVMARPATSDPRLEAVLARLREGVFGRAGVFPAPE